MFGEMREMAGIPVQTSRNHKKEHVVPFFRMQMNAYDIMPHEIIPSTFTVFHVIHFAPSVSRHRAFSEQFRAR